MIETDKTTFTVKQLVKLLIIGVNFGHDTGACACAPNNFIGGNALIIGRLVTFSSDFRRLLLA